MKKLLRTVEKHGLRYALLLENEWGKTEWSKKQVELVCKRITAVTVQIPDIITLAHNRIIRGELLIRNSNITRFLLQRS